LIHHKALKNTTITNQCTNLTNSGSIFICPCGELLEADYGSPHLFHLEIPNLLLPVLHGVL